MTSPWAENTFEVSTETSSGESAFGESSYPTGESEWGSPFAPAEAEQGSLEYGQEYGQEALAPDGAETEGEWESPFTTTGLAADSEIMRTLEEFPKTCDDTTFTGKPWKFGRLNPANLGQVSSLAVVPRAEVFEFQLTQYDVDRHELKRQHRDAIADLTRRVQGGIREQRYSGEPIRVFTYGEASSTASHVHNLELSHNRAFNCLNAIRCEFQKAGITQPVTYGFYGTGEVHARVRGPNQKENPQFRGVVVRVFAPLKDCKRCEQPTPTPTTGTATLCVSVPKIAPRVSMKLPPDLIPLGPLVPGLRLPFAIVTRAQATVRVDEQRSRQSGQYTFQGWGLEVALPAGRTRADLQADLRASLEVLVRASASLGAKLRLGPLKLALRVDVSVFAQLVVKLCAQLRLRLDADLGRPNVPELRQCRLLEARGVRGRAFPFAALAGPAVVIVPGGGYGPGVLHFAGPGVAGLQLSANPIPVPADKSTIKTLLALGGSLQLASAAGREAEYEQTEAEWPEAFEELQPELAPFV